MATLREGFRFIEWTKYYPNTKIFRELYPQGEEINGKWRVRKENYLTSSDLYDLFNQAYGNKIAAAMNSSSLLLKKVKWTQEL